MRRVVASPGVGTPAPYPPASGLLGDGTRVDADRRERVANRKAIVVGAGRVGRRVASDLPRSWTVTVIDSSEKRLELVPATRPGVDGKPVAVKKVLGDASSKLVLERAGVDPSCVLAIVTGDTVVNREVARLARQAFGVEDLVVKLPSEAGIAELGLLPDEVIQSHSGTAALATDRLCANETRAVALGMGQGELRQVTVLEGSPVDGRTLADLSPNRWLIAAVYRAGELIVPHGQTTIHAHDRVLLVGQPDVLDGVGEFIRGSRPVFPNQYGSVIGTLGDAQTQDEAAWVLDHTCANSLMALDSAALHPTRRSAEEIATYLDDNDVGIVVLNPSPVTLLARIGITRSSRMDMILAARVPVLIARDSAPYEKVLLAVSGDQQSDIIASVAIDVARQAGAQLTIMTVTPPVFAEGEAEQLEQRELPNRLARLARMHGIEVKKVVDQGNPIERIRHHAKDFDLVVVGTSAARRSTLLTPDVSLYLLHDTPCSLLLVPWNAAGR